MASDNAVQTRRLGVIASSRGFRYTGVTVSQSLTENVNVSSHYTGWFRVLVYQQHYSWKAVTERWSDPQKACVQHVLSGTTWGDKKMQMLI